MIEFQADIVEGEYGIWGEPWIPKNMLPYYTKFLNEYANIVGTSSSEFLKFPFVFLNSLQFINGINLAYYSQKYPNIEDLNERVKHYGSNSQVTGNTINYYNAAHDSFFNRFKAQIIANERNFTLVPDIIGKTDINGKEVYKILPHKSEPNVGDVAVFFRKISSLALEYLKPNLVKQQVREEYLIASAAPLFMPTTLEAAPIARVISHVVSGVLMKCLGINGEIVLRYFAAMILKSTPSLVAPPVVIAGTAVNASVWATLIPYIGVIIAVVIFIIIILKLMDDEDLEFLGDIWLFDGENYLETIFCEVSGNSKELAEILIEYVRQNSHLSNPEAFILDDNNDPILGVNNGGEIEKTLIIERFKQLVNSHNLYYDNEIWGRGALGVESKWL